MDFIFDIETAPLEFMKYTKVDEITHKEKDIGALSPITGRITALGWRSGDKQQIFIDEDESKILDQFWRSIEAESKADNGFIRLIGFSIKDFDMHFLIVRSLHHNIKIAKFDNKLVLDLREHLAFFKTDKKKGTLSDYAKLIKIDGKYKDIKGEEVPILWRDKKFDDLKEYLSHDLRITEQLYLKCKEFGILGDY